MSNKRTVVGHYARHYCERFPKAPTNQLARKLIEELPLVFTNHNQARNAVRWHRGQNKGGDGKAALDPIAFDIESLPKSHAENIEPWKLDCTGAGLIISDLHIPYHDEAAVYAVLNDAVKRKHTDFLIINGDLCDFYALSFFCKDPTKRRFKDEIVDCQQFLRAAVKHFKRVVYKFGNHEERYSTYLFSKAAELMDLDPMQLNKLLQVVPSEDKESPPEVDPLIKQVKFIGANTIIDVGALTILHGHEAGKGMMAPVNPARGMFLRATASTMSGHLHRTSHHVENTIRRKSISCWSTGCLCGLTPDYAPVNKWDQSAAFLDFDGHDFEITPNRVINGKIY